MAHSNHILEELRGISELVATLPDTNPYQVPPAYFEELPEIIRNGILNASRDETGELLSAPKMSTPYEIPDTYFSELPTAILEKAKLGQSASQDEETLSPLILSLRNSTTLTAPKEYFDELPAQILKQVKAGELLPVPQEVTEILSPLLLSVKTASTFTMPKGYFEEFPELMLKRIEFETNSESGETEVLSPMLANLKHTIPFALPDGYFKDFPEDITAGVRAVDYVNQELEFCPAVICNLKNINVYEAPQGYFETLAGTVLNRVKRKQKSPVINLNFSKKIVRFAVAALVTGIVSIAAWTFYSGTDTPVAKPAGEFADIKKISNDEMVNYLESTPVTSVENDDTASVIRAEDAMDLFADVPDEELRRYLEQNVVSKDLIIN